MFLARPLGAREVSSPITKYAELDLGSVLVPTLGQAATDKLLLKVAGIATPIETLVRTRVVDLSY
jgi:hypothetical protein